MDTVRVRVHVGETHRERERWTSKQIVAHQRAQDDFCWKMEDGFGGPSGVAGKFLQHCEQDVHAHNTCRLISDEALHVCEKFLQKIWSITFEQPPLDDHSKDLQHRGTDEGFHCTVERSFQNLPTTAPQLPLATHITQICLEVWTMARHENTTRDVRFIFRSLLCIHVMLSLLHHPSLCFFNLDIRLSNLPF